ncbi:protein of unknown function [Candidatus Promineifilum breve]|uniref:Oxygen sensor histidine kinase NreB n=1 Tax=Candidatus Promineifilum breve TaxID=1806508 RepID=A0A161KD71_9CHLR|nr:PAS domain-containing sensor histidine kinase [Candidatus Promineifilum breve]CUS06173.1 protein of unknown function [Candidatus Promineifilum breve]
MTNPPDPFASGTFFAHIFHASPVAMIVTTPDDDRYVDVNDAYAALVGIPRLALRGQRNVHLLQPEGATATGARQLVEEPLCLRAADGRLHDVVASTQFEEWDGRPYRITLVQDLTDYNRTGAALRSSEARFRLFFDSIPLPIFVFDLETWRILDVNPIAVELYGYSRDELLTMTMLDIRPPETVASYIATIRALPADSRFVDVWRHRKKDGGLMDMELISYAFDLDGRAVRLHILRDVSEKLALQEALRRNQERLKIVADVTTDVIWEYDMARGAVDTVGLFELFGYAGDSSRPWEWWFEQVHPDERDAVEKATRDALAGDRTIFSTQYRFLHAAGHYIYVYNRIHIVRDADGVARRMIGVTIDVSRQVAMQEAATLAKLEERRRLARDLHDAVTQSLYSLSLMAEVARRHATAGDNRAANEYVGRLGELALQSLKEMRLLVYELRPSALEQEGLTGALQIRLDAVELRSGIQARLMDELRHPLPPDIQREFFLIAEEALNNALKHAAASSVWVRLGSDAHSARLEISDDGQGFDPAAARSSGGLGLISMRERIEKLGGQFSLTTAPGQGTTICVGLEYGRGDNE